MPLICPLCHAPLHISNRSYLCPQKHQFDCGKEGYVNLLPVQHKRSKDPGDNKEMMQARRNFLNAGHYAPLKGALIKTVQAHLPEQESTQILDIGCGEGYYTGALADALQGTKIFGLDISKAMIKAAAKRYANATFIVASSQRLPFEDASLNAIIRIYAPCQASELHRTLEQDGYVITVTPAPRHLYQLKAMIYQDVRLHDLHAEALEGFRLVDETQIHYTLHLNADDATTLLQMTPFAWRANEAVWNTLKQITQFECEADFMLRVYQKI